MSKVVHIDGATERLDSASSAFFQRELLQIMAGVFETPFGPLDAEKLIPQNTAIDPGAEQYAYDRATAHGIAQWLAAGATDIPRAVVDKVRTKIDLFSFALSYGWTVQEIRAAAYARLPLSDMEAKACRMGIDQWRNKVQLQGDTDRGWTGLVNDPNVSAGNATNGNWAAATGDQILQDLNDAWLAVWSNTKKVYMPDMYAVPLASYARLNSTARGASTDTTIWQFFVKNYPGGITPQLVPLIELNTAGASSSKRMIVYKKDPMVLEAGVPIIFDQQQPDQEGMQISIACEGRIGPTHFRVPIAAVYRDNL